MVSDALQMDVMGFLLRGLALEFHQMPAACYSRIHLGKCIA